MSQPNINVENLKIALLLLKQHGKKPECSSCEEAIEAAFPPQPKEEWRPKEGESYFLISTTGAVEICGWEENSFSDKERLKFGNCFPTREAAEAFKAKYLEWRRES